MKKKLLKSFRKKQKQIKKQSRFLLKHPLIIPAISFITLFFTGLLVFVMMGASTQGPSDARIVNIFADGQQRTVTTRAKTVGDLLERVDVKLIDEDIVEPQLDSLILEDDTQINVYRARPVQVKDGTRVFTLLTAQRAPRLVAHDAGLTLYAEDEAKFERVDQSVLESSVSEQLVIARSVPIQLSIYGAVKPLRTTARTVEQLLEYENIQPEEKDTVQPSHDSPISEGMLVALNRPGVKVDSISEAIPFETERIDDASLEVGKTQVQQEGADGIQAVIYEIEEKDGVEISRKQIQVVVVKAPIKRTIVRGTKIVAPTVSVSGDKAALMSAAGIAESDYAYADFIVAHESGWRPGAASSTGAYGLCQALPASKMASAGSDYLSNPVTQLRWCSGYAAGRYGGWAGAYNAWLAQGWW